MPQLVKGGKHVFGWTTIKKGDTIRIPDDAYEEYGFKDGEKLIIMSGSKRSGGFGLSSLKLLENSPIGNSIKDLESLYHFLIPEGEVIESGERSYSWVKLRDDRTIELSGSILRRFSINRNSKLLVARGSGLALGFVSKGPIYEEALKHSNLESY